MKPGPLGQVKIKGSAELRKREPPRERERERNIDKEVLYQEDFYETQYIFASLKIDSTSQNKRSRARARLRLRSRSVIHPLWGYPKAGSFGPGFFTHAFDHSPQPASPFG